MKRFIGKMILFLCLFDAIILGLDVLSAKEPFRGWFAYVTESSDYPAGKDEVALYIEQIREEGDYSKLVVGDSVCFQMTNGLRDINGEYSLVGNNRAVTIAGEYLLVKEFLETHEGITDVYVIVGLDALQTNIDVNYGYQYVAIPFLRDELLQNLEEETIDEMEGTFGKFFMQKTVAELIGDSSVNRKLYLNYIKEQVVVDPNASDEIVLSDLAVEYLYKIYDLCGEYDVTMHLLPDPLADNQWRHTQEEALEKDFEERGLSELFPNYFDEITYYPEEQFVDGIHFGEPYNEQSQLNQKLRELYLDKGYMEGLQLGE